jgi:hypothetical protein
VTRRLATAILVEPDLRGRHAASGAIGAMAELLRLSPLYSRVHLRRAGPDGPGREQ